MHKFQEQIQRIKQKLIRAREIDSEFKVFGAGSHRYILYDPVSRENVDRFENQYRIRLPACYRAFVTEVGNGGIERFGSGAGPYFGIFPFGEKVNYVLYNPEKYLRNVCKLFPGISGDDWNALTQRMCSDDPISDEEYEVELGKVFGGILPLGLQGCSFLHGLIINGPHSGRVVNLDISMSTPKVAKEKNFLDWYERWLDEIISGYLRENQSIWFGFENKS